MCGIAGILNIKYQSRELRNKVMKMAQKIRHSGPDMQVNIISRPVVTAK